jgi:hypothetical protein
MNCHPSLRKGTPDIASYFCFRHLLEYRRNFRRLCRAGEIMAAHFKIMEEVDQAKSNQNMPRHLRSVSQKGCWWAALSRVTTVPECRGSQRGEVRMRHRHREGTVSLHGGLRLSQWPRADCSRHPLGNFLTNPLPEGADVISLVRIVHDHDDASALSLLRAVRRALPPDGTLLIAEAMSGVRGAEPLDAYYGFYTLAMGRGEPRTVAEIGRLLRQAGFGRFRLLRNRMPILTSILVARRTSS